MSWAPCMAHAGEGREERSGCLLRANSRLDVAKATASGCDDALGFSGKLSLYERVPPIFLCR